MTMQTDEDTDLSATPGQDVDTDQSAIGLDDEATPTAEETMRALDVEHARRILFGDLDQNTSGQVSRAAPVKYEEQTAQPNQNQNQPVHRMFRPTAVVRRDHRRNHPAQTQTYTRGNGGKAKWIEFVLEGTTLPSTSTDALKSGAGPVRPASRRAAGEARRARFQSTNAVLAQFLASDSSSSSPAQPHQNAAAVPAADTDEYWDAEYDPAAPTDYKLYCGSSEHETEQTDFRLFIENLTGMAHAQTGATTTTITQENKAPVAVHGDPEFAKRILLRYGWVPGQGLGAHADRRGITKALRLAPVRGARGSGRGRIIDRNVK